MRSRSAVCRSREAAPRRCYPGRPEIRRPFDPRSQSSDSRPPHNWPRRHGRRTRILPLDGRARAHGNRSHRRPQIIIVSAPFRSLNLLEGGKARASIRSPNTRVLPLGSWRSVAGSLRASERPGHLSVRVTAVFYSHSICGQDDEAATGINCLPV